MRWDHIPWIVTPAAALVFLWGSADKQRKAKVERDGRMEFAPNRRAFLAWPVVVAYSAYVTITQLTYSHGRPIQLMMTVGLGAIAVMITLTFPETIIVTADGLEQISWLWKTKADSLGRHRRDQHREQEPHRDDHGGGWNKDRPLSPIARQADFPQGAQRSLRREVTARFSARARYHLLIHKDFIRQTGCSLSPRSRFICKTAPTRVAFFTFFTFPGNSSRAYPRPLDWQPSSSRARANYALERTRCGDLLGLDLTMQCDRLRNQHSGTGLI
jgi:hypothetical protein